MASTKAGSRRDSLLWFGSRETLHRIQQSVHPTYFRKFPLYFEQYGCIHCKRRDVSHCCNGLCSACSALIRLRFDRIHKRLQYEQRPKEPERASVYLQKVNSARQLLTDLRSDPTNRRFLAGPGLPMSVKYLAQGSKRRVFSSDFDTGKLSWKRIR